MYYRRNTDLSLRKAFRDWQVNQISTERLLRLFFRTKGCNLDVLDIYDEWGSSLCQVAVNNPELAVGCGVTKFGYDGTDFNTWRLRIENRLLEGDPLYKSSGYPEHLAPQEKLRGGDGCSTEECWGIGPHDGHPWTTSEENHEDDYPEKNITVERPDTPPNYFDSWNVNGIFRRPFIALNLEKDFFIYLLQKEIHEVDSTESGDEITSDEQAAAIARNIINGMRPLECPSEDGGGDHAPIIKRTAYILDTSKQVRVKSIPFEETLNILDIEERLGLERYPPENYIEDGYEILKEIAQKIGGDTIFIPNIHFDSPFAGKTQAIDYSVPYPPYHESHWSGEYQPRPDYGGEYDD